MNPKAQGSEPDALDGDDSLTDEQVEQVTGGLTKIGVGITTL